MISDPKGHYRCAWCNLFMKHADLRSGRYGTQDDIDGRGLICFRHFAAPERLAHFHAVSTRGQEGGADASAQEA